MKHLILILAMLLIAAVSTQAQDQQQDTTKKEPAKKISDVERMESRQLKSAAFPDMTFEENLELFSIDINSDGQLDFLANTSVLPSFFNPAMTIDDEHNLVILDAGLQLGNYTIMNPDDGILRYNGTDIEARLGGNWTSLTAGGSSEWSINGTGINYNSGNVGIGPIGGDPNNQLTVYSNQGNAAILANNSNTAGYGIRAQASYIGVYADVNDSDDTDSYGTFSSVSGGSGTGTNYGVYGSANAGASGRAYGVYSQNDLKTGTRLFVNTSEATEDANPDREVLVDGEARFIGNSNDTNVIYAEYTGTESDVGAVYGKNNHINNFGYGVHGQGGYMGVRGDANGGTSGTRFGIYGTASGGDRNYAVFASGDLKVTSQLFIGTSATQEDAASDYELLVDGEAIMEELVLEMSGSWPDYVFENDYDLKPLSEVQSFIDENGHLPNVPSAAAMEASDGIPIGQMQTIFLEKIEELTLYMIDQENRMKALEEKNVALEKEVEALKNK